MIGVLAAYRDVFVIAVRAFAGRHSCLATGLVNGRRP